MTIVQKKKRKTKRIDTHIIGLLAMNNKKVKDTRGAKKISKHSRILFKKKEKFDNKNP